MMDKIYSNCPLKKRPIYVIKEEEDIQEDVDDQPVDLSSSAKNSYRPSVIHHDILSKHNEVAPADYRISRLSPIKEENIDVNYNTGYHENYTSNSTNFQQPLQIYAPLPGENIERLYGIPYSPPQSEYNSHPHRDSSISPPFTQDRYIGYPEDSHNYQFNHNNNIIKSDRLIYKSMLSPTPSHLSNISNKSDYASNFSEPEDLSINNNRKVLVLTDSSANIQRHIHDRHSRSSNNLYYQCPSCSKCYSTYAGLVKHQQCHSMSQNVISNNNNNNNYNNNNNNNNNNNRNDCPVQSTITTTAKTITNSSGPSTNQIRYERQVSEKNQNISRYQCRECGKSYSTYSGLTKHQQFHCPASEANQVKKFFSCKNCDKVYVSLGALKMHIRTHTLPCKCPLCGKAFSRPWLLQGHIRTHTGEKPFSCQHCLRAFADRSNLRAHLQTHSEVKKYSCTTCTKTFSRMSLLGKHLQGGCPGQQINSSSNQGYNEEVTSREEKSYYPAINNNNNEQNYMRSERRAYPTESSYYQDDVHVY